MAADLDTGAAYRLACAILLRAAKDARGRGPKAEAARSWLAGDGAIWAEALGICAPDVVEMWVRDL